MLIVFWTRNLWYFCYSSLSWLRQPISLGMGACEQPQALRPFCSLFSKVLTFSETLFLSLKMGEGWTNRFYRPHSALRLLFIMITLINFYWVNIMWVVPSILKTMLHGWDHYLFYLWDNWAQESLICSRPEVCPVADLGFGCKSVPLFITSSCFSPV